MRSKFQLRYRQSLLFRVNVCVSQDKSREVATSELSMWKRKLKHSGSSEWLLKVYSKTIKK